MGTRPLHRWKVTPKQAAALQRRLAPRVVLRAPRGHRVRLVAGLDAAYAGGRVFAAAVVIRLPGLVEVERTVVSMPIPFPYVPGLLSFREAPALVRALRRLRARPDLLLVDGQGLAHPRRFGIACHIGLLAGLPAVGVAKSVLVGEPDEPGRAAGSWTPLLHRGQRVGAALRTRDGGRPVFVSPGHLCDLRAAIRWTPRCAGGHRLPEPTFLADRAVGEAAAPGSARHRRASKSPGPPSAARGRVAPPCAPQSRPSPPPASTSPAGPSTSGPST